MVDRKVEVVSRRALVSVSSGALVSALVGNPTQTRALPDSAGAKAGLQHIGGRGFDSAEVLSIVNKVDKAANGSDFANPATVRTNIGADLGANVSFTSVGTGALDRSIEEKARDIISALDFATGDGVTDDTAGLQAAAIQAGSLRADLAIPATSKFYKLTDEITVPDGVRILGGGRLKQTVVNRNALVLGNNTSVTSLLIEGPSLLSTVDIKNTGIAIDGVTNVQIRNCNISGFETGGILLRNCFDVLIDGNYLHQNDWQGSVSGASGGDIYSYSSTAGGRIVITNNFCMSNSSQGIGVAVNGLDQDVIVAHNVCITLDATGAVRVPNTLVRRHGIELGYISQKGGTAERRFICANNLIGNTLWSGIYMQQSDLPNGAVVIAENLLFDVGYQAANDLSGAVYINARGTKPIIVSDNYALRFRNTNPNTAAFVASSNVAGSGGEVLFLRNVVDGSLSHGLYGAGRIGRVSFRGNITRGVAGTDVAYVPDPSSTATAPVAIDDHDSMRSNTTSPSIGIYTSPAGTSGQRILVAGCRLEGAGTRVAAENAAIFNRYPDRLTMVDTVISNFYRAEAAAEHLPSATRDLTGYIRDRNTLRDVTQGFHGHAAESSSTFIAQDNIFDGVTDRFHDSGLGGSLVAYEGRRNGGRLEIFGLAAAPTTGTWVVGDRTPNQSPIVGRPRAWIVTTAGAPGSWTSEGDL